LGADWSSSRVTRRQFDPVDAGATYRIQIRVHVRTLYPPVEIIW